MNIAFEIGFWRVPNIKLVRQSEIGECGLASLTMIANFHGYKIDLGSMRHRFPPSLRGAPLKALISSADRLGLMPRAVKLETEHLGKLALPAILHWDMNHYVVIERASLKRGALIHDPANGSRWINWNELSLHFTGVALELRPSGQFEMADTRNYLKITRLWTRITGLKRSLTQIVVLTLVLQAFVLLSPYYLQAVLDVAVPALDTNFLTVLACGFGLLVVFNALAFFMRELILVAAGTSLSYGLTTNVVRRLMRLPSEWFERRHVGDILARFQSVIPIQKFLSEGAIGVILDGFMATLTFTVMLLYSRTLAFIGFMTATLYGLVRLGLLPYQRDALFGNMLARGLEQTHLIESMRSITALRLCNREALRHADWQSKFTDSTNTAVQMARVVIWHGTANIVLLGLENVITVYVGARLVIQGGFTVGMLFAYYAYKSQFLTNARSLIDRSLEVQMINLHLERLSDIVLAKEDPSFESANEGITEFVGKIELRDISYRYSATEPFILSNINLIVNPKDHLVITGPSGGGKSTLAKIILGLIEPTHGELLIDGKPLAHFGYTSYREQIAAILQEDTLLMGSIADNIALFDPGYDMQAVAEAATNAAIDAEIGAMPMGYRTPINNMGAGLSAGQRQRILLARALYRKPKLLLVDEGTAHLDLDNEQRVSATIAQLGITRIVIAHRPATIAAASRRLFLMAGALNEVGPVAR